MAHTKRFATRNELKETDNKLELVCDRLSKSTAVGATIRNLADTDQALKDLIA